MSTTDSDLSIISKTRLSIDDSQNLNKYFSNLNLNKIHSIPLTRKNLANSAYVRNRLQIYGYKYFDKISACGKGTYKTLKYMKNSPNLKTVKALEFDPYLCDSSHLTDLVQAMKRFRGIKNLILVVPRVNRINEANILVPFVKKLSKLSELRIDIPSTENINESGLLKLVVAFKRSYSLRKLETNFINTAEPSYAFEMQLMDFHRWHKKLEELVLYHSVKKGTIKEEYECAQLFKAYFLPLLKKVSLTYSVSSEWASKLADGSDPSEEVCLEWLNQFPNLEEISLKMVNSLINSNELLGAFEVLGKLAHLKTVNYESLGCRMGELEMMTALFGITKMKQIKNLNFKVLQYPTVSEMAISKFVEVVANQPNIENFNFYVRRLNLPEEVLTQFVAGICKMNNVYCKRYKGSLHFYRYKEAAIAKVALDA